MFKLYVYTYKIACGLKPVFNKIHISVNATESKEPNNLAYN